MSEEWLLADSNVPNGWSDPENAYDGDEDTYAQNSAGPMAWTSFIELYYDIPLWCTKLRYWYNWSYDSNNYVDLDAYIDGAWQNVYQGSSTWGCWAERNVPTPGMCTAIRVRLQNRNGMFSNTYELREYQAYGEQQGTEPEPYGFVM